MLQKKHFSILAFFAFFGQKTPKKHPKLTKNEENWQSSNCVIKFYEIWYVNASQQKKVQQKNYFSILAFFWPKKQPKLNKNKENWQNSNHLMRFSEIWYVDTSQQKKMLQNTIFYFSRFWPFLDTKNTKKTPKNEENWQNSFDEIFGNL